MSVVTVGCEAEQTDRAEESGERRKVAQTTPLRGGLAIAGVTPYFGLKASRLVSLTGRPQGRLWRNH